MNQAHLCMLVALLLISSTVTNGFFRTGPYFGKRGTETKKTSEIFSGEDTKDIEILRELGELERQPMDDFTRTRHILLQAFKRLSDRKRRMDRMNAKKRSIQHHKQQLYYE